MSTKIVAIWNGLGSYGDFDNVEDDCRFSSILRKMEHEDLGEDPCAIEDLATTVHASPLPPGDLMRARGPG